jgi:hypothetical protein
MAMATGRAYSAGTFALEIGGATAGFLLSAAGGEPRAEVVEEQAPSTWVRKHIGAPKYEDIVIESRIPMSGPLESWIISLFEGKQSVTDGAIVLLDYSMKVSQRLEWTGGLISQVTFPAADGASKETARVRVTITPELTRLVAGSHAAYGKATAGKEKSVLLSHFRFTVSGLEQASAKVSDVAAISVTRRGTDDIGEERDHAHDLVLDVSNIAFRVARSEAGPFATWLDDFVVKGLNDASHERTGSLTFLDQTLKNELLRLDLGGVGIFGLTYERHEARSEVIARAKVELYCETVSLHKSALASPSAASAANVAGISTLATLPRDLPTLPAGSTLPTILTPDVVADRLLASTEAARTASEFDRGRAVGTQWAREKARLDELEAIAALAQKDDWKAITLPDDHSLLAFLIAGGDVQVDEGVPVDLERDELTAGIVAGAADVANEVEPILRERGHVER